MKSFLDLKRWKAKEGNILTGIDMKTFGKIKYCFMNFVVWMWQFDAIKEQIETSPASQSSSFYANANLIYHLRAWDMTYFSLLALHLSVYFTFDILRRIALKISLRADRINLTSLVRQSIIRDEYIIGKPKSHHWNNFESHITLIKTMAA